MNAFELSNTIPQSGEQIVFIVKCTLYISWLAVKKTERKLYLRNYVNSKVTYICVYIFNYYIYL